MARLLRATLFGLLLLVCLGGVSAPSSAGDYPNHPVRFLNGFAPGGPVDTTARIMGKWLSDRLGQQFIIENRTGSGGNIAVAAAVSSPPDGYTLLFVGSLPRSTGTCRSTSSATPCRSRCSCRRPT